MTTSTGVTLSMIPWFVWVVLALPFLAALLLLFVPRLRSERNYAFVMLLVCLGFMTTSIMRTSLSVIPVYMWAYTTPLLIAALLLFVPKLRSDRNNVIALSFCVIALTCWTLYSLFLS